MHVLRRIPTDVLRRLLRLFGLRKDVPTKAQRLAIAYHPERLKVAPDVAQRLHIPVRDTTPDLNERAAMQNLGQFLSRQDRWAELSAQAARADLSRAKTAGGMPVAELMLYGARADVVEAAAHALLHGAPAEDANLLHGIGALEEVLSEHKSDYIIGLTVALAHIDIAWAWRGSDPELEVAEANRTAFAAHFDRAAAILDRFCGLELDSPALAAARCGLLPGSRDPHLRVADDYEDLIDLDPHDPRHMRAMGNHLLPRWFGSYGQLDLEARRTASRTGDIWGDGAYTWVYFDALTHDAGACANVDADFFIDGLRDILHRRPDQATANLLAAYCSIAVGDQLGLQDAGDLTRSRIAACADWIIRDHMTELHPLIWAHAADGFDNAARIPSMRRFAQRGRADAYRVLGRMFRDEIARGEEITFTAQGPRITA
ncbi:MAG: hypothetical protein EP307_02000 [Rhodobacteraceae bacterium]|nr:MAG: hypothetical protein EP307_02000 [Paracoccaceae bacterium]